MNENESNEGPKPDRILAIGRSRTPIFCLHFIEVPLTLLVGALGLVLKIHFLEIASHVVFAVTTFSFIRCLAACLEMHDRMLISADFQKCSTSAKEVYERKKEKYHGYRNAFGIFAGLNGILWVFTAVVFIVILHSVTTYNTEKIREIIVSKQTKTYAGSAADKAIEEVHKSAVGENYVLFGLICLIAVTSFSLAVVASLRAAHEDEELKISVWQKRNQAEDS